jgi:hypothetical protein
VRQTPIWKACLATYPVEGRTDKETAQRIRAAISGRATSRQRPVRQLEYRETPERKPTPARVIALRQKPDARDIVIVGAAQRKGAAKSGSFSLSPNLTDEL